MAEYGIFTDEGCIEAEFTTAGEAEERAEEYRADGEECTVQEMCPDHRDDEQPKNGCEECALEGCGAMDPEDLDACGDCIHCTGMQAG